jgi:hypothetical protein
MLCRIAELFSGKCFYSLSPIGIQAMKPTQISIIAMALIVQSMASIQPASAGYWKHMRHEKRLAAQQEYKAQVDMAEGKYHQARMHERKAYRDQVKATRYHRWF